MLISPRNVSLLLFSITTFSAVCIQAADIPLRGPIPFEAFDKDGSKMITPQEFVETHNLRKKMRTEAKMSPGRNVRSFTSFDTNGDNQISPDELNMNRAAKRRPRADMPPVSRQGMGRGMNQARQMPNFADFDLNNDGELSRDEFNEAREQRMRKRAEQGYAMRNAPNAPPFGAIDQDRDGKVTKEEFAAHQAQRQQRAVRPPGGPWGNRQVGPQGMGRGMNQARQMPSFADFDLNNDGELSRDEFNEAREQRMRKRAEQGYAMRNAPNAPPFGAIDQDRDGKVTKEEFAAHQAQRQQMRRAP